MKDSEKRERKLSFKCCIPKEMTSCTDDELRLSIVTLKNAMMNITVCMSRIERELKNRGASTSIFRSIREKPLPELLELATTTTTTK
ncbi:MAG: hypothetical protein ACFFDM_05160 [Candidatus Thorarchaeota archaeon]